MQMQTIHLSEVITDIAAGPFGSNLKVSCFVDDGFPIIDGAEVTLTSAEVKRLILAIDPTGDDLVLNYDSRGGMGYPSRAWYNRAVNDTLRMTMETSESDSEILAELANGMGDPGTVLKAAREVLGYDGYIAEGKYDNATVYVAFDSSQFKNADNLTPTSDPDIRYQLRSAAEVEQEIRDLKRERTVLASRNKALEQRVQALKGEMRISKEPSVVLRDVKKLGLNTIRQYGSDVKYADIQPDMEALGKAVMKKDVSMAHTNTKPPHRVVLCFVCLSPPQAGGLHDGLHRHRQLVAPCDVHVRTAGAVQQLPGVGGQQLLAGVVHHGQLLQALLQTVVLRRQPCGDGLADLLRVKTGSRTPVQQPGRRLHRRQRRPGRA